MKMEKYDGKNNRNLTVSEAKQIGGRAGRFGSEFSDGEVTT
jgi:ATP-dependent RNA helicase SUPV3L1/SUV3